MTESQIPYLTEKTPFSWLFQTFVIDISPSKKAQATGAIVGVTTT
jgi:hypothetical protein